MPVLRRLLPRAVVPVATVLLLGATAGAAQASGSVPATGAVVEVTPPGAAEHASAQAIAGAQHTGSVGAAQTLASKLSARENVTIVLPDGTYRLPRPITISAAETGRNGHTITWKAARGAHPVITGARQVTGWHRYDAAKNIWVANVGKGTDSRQLYVNGHEAPLASIALPRSSVTFTATGLTINDSSLGYLATLPDQNQIELESLDSFTDRYAPVESITGGTVTMQQPAWANNNWGYDVLARPFEGGSMYLENSEAFLQQAGQWSIDSATGQLFYEAPAGQTMHGLDVELPRLQSLLDIGGSYSHPAQGLAFEGITFTGTSWLQPGTDEGYADQQSGTFITGTWQQPRSAAVSAAVSSSRPPGSTGTRCQLRCRSPRPATSRSAATPSPILARPGWASATTPTPTRPESASEPATSPSTATHSPATQAAG